MLWGLDRTYAFISLCFICFIFLWQGSAEEEVKTLHCYCEEQVDFHVASLESVDAQAYELYYSLVLTEFNGSYVFSLTW